MKTSTVRHKKKSNEDLKAAQESINQSNAIYELNQRINTLNASLHSLESLHDKSAAKSSSDHKDLVIAFENLKSSVDDSIAKMDQRIGNIESSMIKLSVSYISLVKDIGRDYLTKDDFKDYFDKQNDVTRCIEQDLSIHKDSFNRAILALNTKIREEVQKVKQELTPVIPATDPVQEKIDAKFNVFKLDFDGLVKEIALLKRSSNYAEKKFENLYTLIDRLKEGMCHKKV